MVAAVAVAVVMAVMVAVVLAVAVAVADGCLRLHDSCSHAC